MATRIPSHPIPSVCAALLALIYAATAAAAAVSAEPPTASPPDSIIGLPALTGYLAVGTFTASWTDSSRTDTTAQGAGPRSVGIQFWYPADGSRATALAPYAPGVDTAASDYGRLMARVRGHAAWRPTFVSGLAPAPVVVLSTGRTMAAYDYSSIAEDLASHGYVVIGVNSPRLSRYSTPDGEVIPPLPAPPLKVLQHFDEADVFFEPMVRQVAADLRFVLDMLERVDRSEGILGGHLDLRRVAMMGHSNGALAASRACAEDQRCRAFLGIEGTQTREIRKHGVRKPYALLISDQSLAFDVENVYRELGSHRGTSYTVLIVKGAGHNTFSDLLLVRPTLFHYAMGATRGVDIARVAIRAFLDEKLLGHAARLKSALTDYPEAEVQTTFPPVPMRKAP